MGEIAPQDIIVLWPLPIAVVVLLLLRVMGWLGRDTFSRVPHRAAGLQPLDLLIGIIILMLGSQLGALAQQLAIRQSTPDGQTLNSMQQAMATLLGQLLGQGPVVAYLLFRVSRELRGPKEVGLTPRRPAREITAAIIGLLLTLPLILSANGLAIVVGKLVGSPAPVDEIGHDMLRTMRQADSHLALAIMVTSAVIIAPVLEEIFFRGLVQTTLLEILGRKRRWTIITLASLAFVAPHVGTGAWHVLPGLFVLAMLFGWLYERTGSLLPSILAHMAFNGLNILLAFGKPPSPDAAEAMMGLSAAIRHLV